MKKNILILFLMLFTINIVAQTPYYSEKLGGYLLNSEVYKGDTIASVTLREVPIYPAPKFKSKKTEKFYWKTVRDVKKVYPYMKFIGAEYKRINAICDTISDPKEKKKYMKMYEKQLLAEYKPVMKKFTLSQGKMLIKLIDRELEATSYDLIKQFRGGFVAWWWQVFAKMLGADLKDDYDATEKEKDRIIERVITLYEAGVL
jgi:hypothetical protein